MSARAVAGIALVLGAAAAPFLPGVPPYWITVASYAGIAALVALGIAVLTGQAGIVSFGQAMFVGIGAYATAIPTTRYGWHPLATLPLSIGLSCLVAGGVGAVTLRLKGHYLPVATLAWNISFFYLMGSLDWTRRYEGIAGIPPLTLGPVSFADGARLYLLIGACLLAALWTTRNLLDSRAGRTIRALRGGTLAAESCGVDTARARMVAFVYAAALAGLAGWLYAHLQRAINPTPFGIVPSIDYLLMAVAGGVGTLGGAVLGAGIITLIRDKLQDVLPWLLDTTGNYETIVFGFLLIAILQFAPEGLWPHLVRRGKAGPRRAAVEAEPLAASRTAPAGDALAVSGLRKVFGGLVAVDDLGFTVAPGEIVGLIGPNGAGKSTSFNLVTGVAPPTAGTVAVAGTRTDGWPARRIARLGLARTFQHVKLAPAMSVIENVAIGAHLLGRRGAVAGALGLDGPEEARVFATARAALDRVGLSGLAAMPAGELALGQQRLVEIARALCLDPVLLLLDEPAAGLRHAEKDALAGLLRRLRESGMAVLLVEHDMDFVMTLTDRLVVMNFGSELARGRPDEIQRNPAVRDAYLGSAPA